MFKVPKYWKYKAKVELAPYQRKAYLFTSYKQYKRAMECMTKEEFNIEDASGMCTPLTKNNKFVYFIGVFNREKSTLVHELGHMAIFIAKGIGYDPKNESEPFCYLMGNTFRKFEKYIK